MKFRRIGSLAEDVKLQMTPMIDIVFQLLVFFVMSFKFGLPEGDFNIKMPLAAPSHGVPDEIQLPPIKVRMIASEAGDLAGLLMNGQPLSSFDALHQRIIHLVGSDSGPGSVVDAAEVELDCDFHLKYRHVIEAISSISGYVTPDQRVVKLIEKIKFSPPKAPQ